MLEGKTIVFVVQGVIILNENNSTSLFSPRPIVADTYGDAETAIDEAIKKSPNINTQLIKGAQTADTNIITIICDYGPWIIEKEIRSQLNKLARNVHQNTQLPVSATTNRYEDHEAQADVGLRSDKDKIGQDTN